MRAIMLVALVALAGCAGVDGDTYLGRPGSPAWHSTASAATKAAYFREQCTAYGFTPGTEQMAQCIQNEAVSSRMAASARSSTAAAIAASSQPRMVQTSCNRFGNTVNCTSY